MQIPEEKEAENQHQTHHFWTLRTTKQKLSKNNKIPLMGQKNTLEPFPKQMIVDNE